MLYKTIVVYEISNIYKNIELYALVFCFVLFWFVCFVFVFVFCYEILFICFVAKLLLICFHAKKN